MKKIKTNIQLKTRNPLYFLMFIYLAAFVYKITFQDQTNFISQHVSNFAITGLIMSSEMFKSVRKGSYSLSRFRDLAIISIGLNILVELISIGDIKLPFSVTETNFNTADPIDALFGIVGVLLFVLIIKQCSNSDVMHKKK